MIDRIGLRVSRRHLVAFVAIAVLLSIGVVVVLVIGTSGSSRQAAPRRGPAPAPRSVDRHSDTSHPSVSPPADTASAPSPLGRTDDPDQYAREVATALFGVQPAETTRANFLRFWQGELPTVVYADAQAKGLTFSAQNSDAIANLVRWWIPSTTTWSSEAADLTSNKFAVTSVTVPDYWANAVAEGKFQDPGLHMERVMGVLTQIYGTDPHHRYTSARSVVIDLALLCGPTQPGGCRLVAPQQPPSAGNESS